MMGRLLRFNYTLFVHGFLWCSQREGGQGLCWPQFQSR